MLLLERNRVLQVSRLVDAAWDEDPPPTAAHQVRKIVAELRRRVPGGSSVIATDGTGYRIVLGEGQLDLDMFEIRLRRAREADTAGLPENSVAQLQAALQLWRGPPLAGIDNALIRAAVVVLEESRLTAVERLWELRLAQGEARGLVAELRALHAEYPLRETITAQLMVALYRSGRQAEALGVYDDARRTLADELGVDPGPELARLHERVLRNDPGLDPPPPRDDHGAVATQPPTVIAVDTPPPRLLPYDLSDFVGRAEELDRLVNQARTAVGQGLTILAVDGMAGVGKTALAVHAAHRLAPDFPDGQLFLDLCGFTPGREPMDPSEALDILLRAVGVPSEQIPDDLRARSALWRVQAAGRKLVVLLDNAAETGQVRPLLPGVGHSLVILTSRPRLVGLDGAVPISLELPPPAEGLALLTSVLGAERVDGAPEDARTLIEACGRLPLALRIAAARLHNRPRWTIRYLVDRLRNEERRVSELTVDDRSVAAAIELSYRSLGADHQRMFRLVGMHLNAEIDANAAAALADVPFEKAEALLEDLLDVRLLTQRQLGRYAFHDILRSFARHRAHSEEAPEDRAAALHRLVDYYLCSADAAANLVQPGRLQVDQVVTRVPATLPDLPDWDAAMAWFDDERSALVAAVRHAFATGLDRLACQLPRALAYHLQMRGHLQDLQTVLETSVAAARRLRDRTVEGRSLINLSIPHWHCGRFTEALECARSALEIAEEVGDTPSLGMCQGRIGMLLNSLGRYTEAIDHHELALRIYRAAGIRREESTTLSSLSLAHVALGRYEDALDAARASVTIDHELGDRGGEAIGLVNVASAYLGLARYDSAGTMLDRAMELAHEVGSPNAEAVVTAHHCDLYLRLGRYDDAEETGRQALGMLQIVRRPAMTAAVLNTLGAVARARGEYSLAAERHEQARELAEGIGFRIELARALDGAAHAHRHLGDTAAAQQRWTRALELFEDMGTPEADVTRQQLVADPESGSATRWSG